LLRTRSRGNSLPRDACRVRAASPPPCSTAAILSRKSATSAAIAARFCANSGSRGESFVASSTRPLFLQRCETRGQQHKQSADGQCQPPGPPCTVAQSTTRAAREPGHRQIDEQTVDV